MSISKRRLLCIRNCFCLCCDRFFKKLFCIEIFLPRPEVKKVKSRNKILENLNDSLEIFVCLCTTAQQRNICVSACLLLSDNCRLSNTDAPFNLYHCLMLVRCYAENELCTRVELVPRKMVSF